MSKRRRRDWPWPTGLTFKQIIEGLGASNVADQSTTYSFSGENCDFDETEADGKWTPIFPKYDDIDEAKHFFDSHGYDVPEREDSEEDDEYLERLNEQVRDLCHENEVCQPMMNYYYEIDLRQSAEEAQARLERYGGSCILVNVSGEPKLCLAGGGMDLTWDIAWAYILCGQLPPTKYCKLPNQCEKLTRRNRLTIAACRKSIRVHKQWLDGTCRDLEHTVRAMYEGKTSVPRGQPVRRTALDRQIESDTISDMQ